MGELIKRFEVHPVMISKWKQKFIEHGAEVFEKKKESGNEIDTDKFYSKIGKPEMENDFLKKLKENRTMKERQELVDKEEGMSMGKQREVLSVNRSGLYYAPVG